MKIRFALLATAAFSAMGGSVLDAAAADPWAGWAATAPSLASIQIIKPTLLSRMPRSGAASFRGATIGRAEDGSAIVGGVVLNASFVPGGGTLSGSLNNLRGLATNAPIGNSLDPVNASISALITGNSLSGSTSATITSPITTVGVGGTPISTTATTLLNGNISGNFYGKSANAVAGSWTLGSAASGAFGAIRR